MPINSGLQGWGRAMEPGLRKLFFASYNEKKEQFSQVFNVQTSTKAIETDAYLGGFSEFNTKDSMGSTEYEDLTKMDTVMYKHVTFSKGFQVDKETVDDEQYNIIKKAPKELGRAARHTIESRAASVLNSAYTAANGRTGEALISATHTLLGGGTAPNYVGAYALSEANLELAFKMAREQVDERGLKVQMMMDVLVVPGALEFTAEKIAKSVQLPGTNNNDINPLKGRFKVVVLDFLTDPTAWFLIDSTMNPLNFFWREKLNFKSTTDFDTDQAKYKGRFRMSYGWTDWRGIIGAKP